MDEIDTEYEKNKNFLKLNSKEWQENKNEIKTNANAKLKKLRPLTLYEQKNHLVQLALSEPFQGGARFPFT